MRQRLCDYLQNPEPVIPRSESPVMIIGMHRSGTSLTTRLLEHLGASMGSRQEIETNEAFFFRHRNELMFSLAHAAWDNPMALSRTLEIPRLQAAFARIAQSNVDALCSRHLATPDSTVTSTQIPVWGFKDPRTTITLPVWLSIFPNAKVINIVRHGQAVATSLLEREKRQVPRRVPLSLVSLDTGLSLNLWAEYVLAAHRNSALLPANQYCEIRYENLLSSPAEVIHKLAGFVGLPADDEHLAQTARLVHRSTKPMAASSFVTPIARQAFELYDYQH